MRTLPTARVAGSGRTARRRLAYAALAALLLAAIVFLTMMPPCAKQFLHTRGHFHTLAHVVAFLGLAFAAGRAARLRKVAVPLFAGLVLFGFCTELAEHIFFEVSLEWKDIVADAVGSSLGLFLVMLMRRRRAVPVVLASADDLA